MILIPNFSDDVTEESVLFDCRLFYGRRCNALCGRQGPNQCFCQTSCQCQWRGRVRIYSVNLCQREATCLGKNMRANTVHIYIKRKERQQQPRQLLHRQPLQQRRLQRRRLQQSLQRREQRPRLGQPLQQLQRHLQRLLLQQQQQRPQQVQ